MGELRGRCGLRRRLLVSDDDQHDPRAPLIAFQHDGFEVMRAARVCKVPHLPDRLKENEPLRLSLISTSSCCSATSSRLTQNGKTFFLSYATLT